MCSQPKQKGLFIFKYKINPLLSSARSPYKRVVGKANIDCTLPMARARQWLPFHSPIRTWNCSSKLPNLTWKKLAKSSTRLSSIVESNRFQCDPGMGTYTNTHQLNGLQMNLCPATCSLNTRSHGIWQLIRCKCHAKQHKCDKKTFWNWTGKILKNRILLNRGVSCAPDRWAVVFAWQINEWMTGCYQASLVHYKMQTNRL